MNTTKNSPELAKALAILSRDPHNSGAHIQAGVYYSQNKKYADSIFHLKKALAKDKKNVLILEKLADVSIKLGAPAQARNYARKFFEINKRNPTALHTMARTYAALGELNKAVHWIDLALQLDPDNLRMLGDKANYYSYAGEIDKSLVVHRKILKLNPHSPNSWWSLCQLQKLEGETAKKFINKINAAIATSTETDELRGMHYAAGKLHHDTAVYDTAINHIEKANVLHDVPISADRIIAANINFRETYSKEFFDFHVGKEKTERTANENRPIFILGQTRSGTTLTESLCASHTNISAGGELIGMTDQNRELDIYAVLEKRHRKNIHDLDKGRLRAIAKLLNSRTRHLRPNNTRLTDKMPHNFLNIGLIALVFPNARIIHCRRHPMDNCLSIYSNPMTDYHKEYKSRLEVLGEYYRNYVQIMEFWKETCPIAIHDVFYEDLVTNTESVARGMIDYLGEEWEDTIMERGGSQKAVKTLSVWQVRQPVFQTSKGKWRKYEKQLQPLRDALGTCVEDYENELAQLDG